MRTNLGSDEVVSTLRSFKVGTQQITVQFSSVCRVIQEEGLCVLIVFLQCCFIVAKLTAGNIAEHN